MSETGALVRPYAADGVLYVRQSGRYQSKYIDLGFDGVEVSTKLS